MRSKTGLSEKLGILLKGMVQLKICYNIPTISKVMDIAYVYGVVFDDLYTVIRISREKYNILKIYTIKPDGEKELYIRR